MKKRLFKKFGGELIEDIVDYIKNYLNQKDKGDTDLKRSSNIKIAIGCDSKTKGRKYTYAITIVFYNDFKRDGAHVVFKRFNVPKSLLIKGKTISQWNFQDEVDSNNYVNDGDRWIIFQRLYNEAIYLYELGKYLDEELKGFYYRNHEKNDYDGSVPFRLPEIHLDLNYLSNNGHNKSYEVYKQVMGMFCGDGFKVMSKPYSYASSSAADLICRN